MSAAMKEKSNTRGEVCLEEGKKALGRFTLFGFGKEQKYEDAANAFKAAGDAFKTGDSFLKAANAYEQASKHFYEADKLMENDSIQCLIEAANMYKRSPDHVQKSIDTYMTAIEKYNNNGRFSRSCQYLKEVAQLCENEGMIDTAYDAYEQGHSLYVNDNKPSQAEPLKEKMALIRVKQESYIDAASLFSQMGRDGMARAAGKYKAKSHFFMACLCAFAGGDVVAVTSKLNEFQGLDPSFAQSREFEVLDKMVQAFQDTSADDFTAALDFFDKISPLTEQQMDMCIKARSFIEIEDDGDDAVGAAVSGFGASGDDDFDEDDEDLS
jgi:alpha-soluble NSF attachment protein